MSPGILEIGSVNVTFGRVPRQYAQTSTVFTFPSLEISFWNINGVLSSLPSSASFPHVDEGGMA